MALVSPHTCETKRVLGVGRVLDLQQVLDDLGEVTQVELVVELLGGGHELGRQRDAEEHGLGRINNSLGVAVEGAVEVAEVVLEHLMVDRVKNFLFGDTERNHSKVAGQTQVNHEGAGLGVEATEEHDVLEGLLLLKVLSKLNPQL